MTNSPWALPDDHVFPEKKSKERLVLPIVMEMRNEEEIQAFRSALGTGWSFEDVVMTTNDEVPSGYCRTSTQSGNFIEDNLLNIAKAMLASRGMFDF